MMVVLILERVPSGLRGELTRWLLEPQAGVFVGRVSALVRQKLWELACGRASGGGCLMIYSSNNEQGFRIETWGRTARLAEDFEGLFLIRIAQNQ
jgi:CRISPR-associated protein Cas2